MAKVVDVLAALFVYFCIATVLTILTGVVALGSRGYLTKDRMVRIAAVMHGADIASAARTETDRQEEAASSYDEITANRSVQGLDLALREQYIERGLAETRDLRQQLEEQVQLYKEMRAAFQRKLENLEKSNQTEGIAKTRELIEGMKPRQAKDQLLRMISRDKEVGLQTAVTIITSLPRDKQKRLFVEFKNDQDKELLSQLMEEIRRGEPVNSIIQETKKRLPDVTGRGA